MNSYRKAVTNIDW